MMNLYEELFTMKKVVVPLHYMQQKSRENEKYLKVVHIAIILVHEWGMKYRGAPPELVKNTWKQAQLEKDEV